MEDRDIECRDVLEESVNRKSEVEKQMNVCAFLRIFLIVSKSLQIHFQIVKVLEERA